MSSCIHMYVQYINLLSGGWYVGVPKRNMRICEEAFFNGLPKKISLAATIFSRYEVPFDTIYRG